MTSETFYSQQDKLLYIAGLEIVDDDFWDIL